MCVCVYVLCVYTYMLLISGIARKENSKFKPAVLQLKIQPI